MHKISSETHPFVFHSRVLRLSSSFPTNFSEFNCSQSVLTSKNVSLEYQLEATRLEQLFKKNIKIFRNHIPINSKVEKKLMALETKHIFNRFVMGVLTVKPWRRVSEALLFCDFWYYHKSYFRTYEAFLFQYQTFSWFFLDFWHFLVIKKQIISTCNRWYQYFLSSNTLEISLLPIL